jgi:hypothetical protein
LVVEDKFLIADALMKTLADAGYTVIGPVSRVAGGRHIIHTLNGQIDATILGIDLAGERSDPIAEELSRQDVPFMFATAQSPQGIAPRFADRPSVNKPYGRDLLRILSNIVKR